MRRIERERASNNNNSRPNLIVTQNSQSCPSLFGLLNKESNYWGGPIEASKNKIQPNFVFNFQDDLQKLIIGLR